MGLIRLLEHGRHGNYVVDVVGVFSHTGADLIGGNAKLCRQGR